jgi:hypothetical protein
LGVGNWDLGIVCLLEQFASGPNGTLDLPKGATPLVGKRIQCANISQCRELVAAESGTLHDIFDRSEATGQEEFNCPFVRTDVAVIRPSADSCRLIPCALPSPDS